MSKGDEIIAHIDRLVVQARKTGAEPVKIFLGHVDYKTIASDPGMKSCFFYDSGPKGNHTLLGFPVVSTAENHGVDVSLDVSCCTDADGFEVGAVE